MASYFVAKSYSLLQGVKVRCYGSLININPSASGLASIKPWFNARAYIERILMHSRTFLKAS